MFRNTVLYRRFWYIKRQNARKISVLIKLTAIIIIFASIVSYSRKMIYPYIMEYALGSFNDLAFSAVNDAVNDLFKGSMAYSRLVSLENSGENVVSLHMDMAEAGRLTQRICQNIERRLKEFEKEGVPVPFGTLLGNPLFSRIGPNLRINIITSGKVETELKSEFSGIAPNRTMHKIVLEVKAVMRAGMPFIADSFNLSATVPVAEKVIIGIIT